MTAASKVDLRKPPLTRLEWATLAHVGIFVVWTTWAYGGGAEWMRPHLAWWGTLGSLIMLTALLKRDAGEPGSTRPLMALIPFVAFNVFVILGTLNPSFREAKLGNEGVLLNVGGNPWLPSSSRPQLALPALWLFDAMWLSCFNLALVVRQRRTIRGLLLLVVLNALALAVFGTAQKLLHADGPYFGEVVTRQTYFFATFIYHNHWGAFMLLMVSTCLGFIWHYARRRHARNFFHSPAFGGLVLLLFLAATVPLSGSRSSTILIVLLLSGAFLHWTYQTVRERRRLRESATPTLLAALFAVALGVAGIWYVARDTIATRAALTRTQVDAMLARGSIGARATLYRDTWRMAEEKIWFGWGMGSYPHVFTLFNSQTSVDRLPVFYRDAHSDWLQALAEHGIVGSGLLALCALVPLSRIRLRHLGSPLPAYLLLGCALLLLYAWIEFPFGNVAVVLCWWLGFFCALQHAKIAEATTAAQPQI